MSASRLLLFLLPCSLSLAFGSEKELFEPLPEPEKTWDHYTKTYFPAVKKGSGVLHIVTLPSLKKTVGCLSILREETEEGNRYVLYARTLGRDGGTEQERKRLEISTRFSSSLGNLSSAALRFTGDAPAKPKGLDGTSTLLFVDTYRRPVGVTHSPARKSVPARVIRFFEALWEDVQDDGTLDESAWIDRSRAVKNDFPPLPFYPTYSEEDADLLKKDLQTMKEWQLTHQVEYLKLDGFTDSESLTFRQELAESLAEVAPKEWKALMKSSGNMHNPRVTPIRPFVDEATRKTSSVQRINQILAAYQLKVSGLSFEKLSFATKTGGGLPAAIMHFKVEPIE